jgi:tRNA modification GTPase
VSSASSSGTIVAAATPPGRGGVGIVRVSGAKAAEIARAVLGKLPEPRYAQNACFRAASGECIDAGLALYFPAPHSFTGEDVLELQGHGGPVVIAALIARVVELGARRALPGEFTQRAYLNDKLDLAQAEAVADLIDAGSQSAARAALRSLQGEFSGQVHRLAEALADLRAYVEAVLDFPEEELDFLSEPALGGRLEAVRAQFDALAHSTQQGRLLTEGMTVVIAGPPNAGKSTLLNRLAGFDAAIVTDVPGTTRDVLRERIHIDGMPLHVIDTAGLRDTVDVIESEGIRRAQVEMARADRLLFIVDAAADPGAAAFAAERARLPADVPVTVVYNKIDVIESAAALAQLAAPVVGAGVHTLRLSAKTGAGIEALRRHLQDCMGYQVGDSGSLSARARHVEALQRARHHLDEAVQQLRAQRAGELVAEELRLAQRSLGEITGEVTTEDLLGRIFASFCIGK